ncbi:Fe-S protein [Microbacterium sp. SORGH_AS_0862]|uniref:Fe-S protein n=1 Tax=Microbacterium sp. SORGH_AS_0862 TaxID=3041789 RepID=UPI002791BFFB|nr:Fe-S protein [Microbacterium sp. SORGH_AS_0862]MDQ1204305.1 putative membrane protein YqjE [Microbacterium sp. SORGH_AS_0862]
MEILRHIVVLVHLVGFAILFGAWVVEAASRRIRITRLMSLGMTIAAVAGLALAAPWGTDHDMNYVKIGVKLVVLLVIAALLGIGSARQRRTDSLPAAIFWPIGVLTLANAAIAVLWR